MWVLARAGGVHRLCWSSSPRAVTSISVSVAALTVSALVAMMLLPTTRVRASAVDSPHAAENRKGLLKVGLAAGTPRRLIVYRIGADDGGGASMSVVALAVDSDQRHRVEVEEGVRPGW